VTVGPDGLPLISYNDATNLRLKVVHCGDRDCSASVNPNTITTVDGAGTSVGQYTSVTVGADGLPIISYYDATNTSLKVAHCGDPDCSASVNPNTITTVDVGNVGTYTSVTVGADGLPVISYYDATNTNLKVAHCSNATCSASTTTTVDGAGTNVGISTSVTVGADGLPLVSFYDATNLDLKVAHCANRFCVPYHRPR
jgi:predicted regulator of Ras-like GTPase activity (Roadblock/LC7/MglB family)